MPDSRWIRTLTLATLVAMTISAGLVLGVFSPMQRVVRDAVTKIASTYPPAYPDNYPDVAVVAIDTQSAREIGHEWPFPRSQHAKLVRNLNRAGARVIGFDVAFATEMDAADDETFVRALEETNNVVLGGFRQFSQIDGVDEPVEFSVMPPPNFMEAAAALGNGNVFQDDDGVVRHAPRTVEMWAVRVPLLAYASVNLVLQEEHKHHELSIDYRRWNPPIPTIPYYKVIDDSFDHALVKDRIVLVGSTTPEHHDLWPTPISKNMPGVHIHALIARTLLAEHAGESSFQDESIPLQIALIFALSGLVALFAGVFEANRALGLLGILVTIASSAIGFPIVFGILIDPVAPFVAVAAQYVLSSETVRARFRDGLTEREHSLSTLFRVGETAVGPTDQNGIQLSLALLGDVVDATSVALAIADEDGRITREPVQWSRAEKTRTVDMKTARATLKERAICEFQGNIPGREKRGGFALYNPLYAADVPVGVLVVERKERTRLDDIQLRTIVTVGAQLSLALSNQRLIEGLRREKYLAEAASRAKGEFLANMSHEIRTPMNAILGYVNLIEELDEPPEARASYREAIHRNGAQLLQIINDILDLSQIESGQISLGLTKVRAVDIVNDVTLLLQSKAVNKQLDFHVEYIGLIPETIETDPIRLRQILMHVIGNAIKFTERGSVQVRIRTIDADTANPQLQFEVVDTGVGMTEEALLRIFEPFVQVDTSSTRQFGGTGLGLAITRRLLDVLNGEVRVHSIPSNGSTFTVYLPTGPLDDVANIAATPPARLIDGQTKSTVAVTRRFSGKVLVAEDGIDNQRLVRMLLKKAGFQVEIAENGQAATDAVCAAEDIDAAFDLILMDIDMPVMDGYEATRWLREHGFEGPIIAFTAHALAGDRERCLSAGCDDYLTKPVDRDQLLDMIGRYLEEKKILAPG